jgi:NAD+ synthase
MTHVEASILQRLRASTRGVGGQLVSFLREEVRKTGRQCAVVGLSGGVDSAVVAYLAVAALGVKSVFPVQMWYKTSNPASKSDAQAVVRALGVEEIALDISAQIDAYFEHDAQASALRRGNKMARERMSILFDRSAQEDALVLGTSNKTELLLGYGTQFGDLASAVNPLGDLYKTQVWALASELGVPETIVRKAPSADLWQDQTDEAELGFSYGTADAILHLLYDERLTVAQVVERGFDVDVVARIAARVQRNQYKRRMPVIAKVSSRTIGIDFRYPRDWGL